MERTRDHLAMVPKLTASNHGNIVLNLEGIELNLGDLKTLEPTLNKTEQKFMDSHHPPKYHPGYINDSIIDAFLLLCKRENPAAKLYIISASRGSAIGQGTADQRKPIVTQLKSVDWAAFNHILCPVNIGRHWVLVHIETTGPQYNLTGTSWSRKFCFDNRFAQN